MKQLKAVAAISLCLLGGCRSNSDTIYLRMAYASNAEATKKALAQFGKALEQKTAGKIKVVYFPDAQLGGERELVELTQTGAVDLAKIGGGGLESFNKIFGIFSLPFLMDDKDHFLRVLSDEAIMKPIMESTLNMGFISITYYDSGQRSFYTKNRPILKPDDLKGLKIRVQPSETALQMVRLLGGSPTPMDSGEVYTALQQGILDGAENNEFALTDAGHGEVSKAYSYSGHTRVPDFLIMNEHMFHSLSPEHQSAVLEAAAESSVYQFSLWDEAIEEAKNFLEKQGVRFYENVDVPAFQEALSPMHENFARHDLFGDTYKAIRAKANQ